MKGVAPDDESAALIDFTLLYIALSFSSLFSCFPQLTVLVHSSAFL